jgi:polar amino acid transport system substrate-binding protein
MRRVPALIAVLVTFVAVAGCGSTSGHALHVALAALGAPGPKPTPAAPSTPAPRCSDLTASLRPPATLPAPRAMPAGGFMARIERRGYLIAGVDQNTLLFAYFNPLTQRLEGFEIDLLRQLAQAIFGDPGAIQFKAITTAERIPAVQSGSVDVVADAMTITCQRRTQVDFSSVYYDAAQRLLVPINSPIHGAGDLGGKRVCATIGSTSIATVESLRPRPTPFPVAQRTDCLVALQQGQADAISTDDAILLGFKAQDPYSKIIGPRLADEPYGMAISKTHPEFVRFVNGVLAQMRANGTWRSIYARWLGKYSSTPAPPAARYSG